jgi:predicted GH43/DUF377 family glycosyl hydrolase
MIMAGLRAPAALQRVTSSGLSLWIETMIVMRLLLPFLLLVVIGADVRADAELVLEPETFPGWERNHVFHPFVLFRPESGYRMYYSAGDLNDVNAATWGRRVTGLAVSTDGTRWERNTDDFKPALSTHRLAPGEVFGPRAQAAVFDSMYADHACVIRAKSGYRMWYTGWNGRTEDIDDGQTQIDFRIGYATSRDGRQWTRQAGAGGAGSTLGLGAPGEPDAKGAADPHVLSESGTYRMWYEGFDGKVWRILHATSPDGITWCKDGAVLAPGGEGSPDQFGARYPVVINRKGRYELWYQGQGASANLFRILRAKSDDGRSWKKTGIVALHPDPPLSVNERIHVGSVIAREDGACEVFFSRQVDRRPDAPEGATPIYRYQIYREVID